MAGPASMLVPMLVAMLVPMLMTARPAALCGLPGRCVHCPAPV